MAGAGTRADVNRLSIEPLIFVDEAHLLENLDSTRRVVQAFEKHSQPPNEGLIRLGHYSDHEMRGRDLRDFALAILQSMSGQPGPRIYETADRLTFPAVLVVWQYAHYHKVLKLSEGNDNRSVSVLVGRGRFAAEPLRLTIRKEHPTDVDVLMLASFLKDEKTIYPHIEEYEVCDPACR